jgi:hypothetical protein
VYPPSKPSADQESSPLSREESSSRHTASRLNAFAPVDRPPSSSGWLHSRGATPTGLIPAVPPAFRRRRSVMCRRFGSVPALFRARRAPRPAPWWFTKINDISVYIEPAPRRCHRSRAQPRPVVPAVGRHVTDDYAPTRTAGLVDDPNNVHRREPRPDPAYSPICTTGFPPSRRSCSKSTAASD